MNDKLNMTFGAIIIIIHAFHSSPPGQVYEYVFHNHLMMHTYGLTQSIICYLCVLRYCTIPMQVKVLVGETVNELGKSNHLALRK